MKEMINKIRVYYCYFIMQLLAHFMYASLECTNKWVNTHNFKGEDLKEVRALYDKRRRKV